MALLTKSKYMNGLQCPRLLWFAEKKLLPDLDLSTKQKFAMGHEFEEYVKLLYPKGIDATCKDFCENLKLTKKLVNEKKTIFEAGFMINGLYARSDLIIPVGEEWDLYEIKSSTEAKDVHITDLAFQKFVLEKNGLKIRKCFVIHLNKDYVKEGEINPKKLIKIQEVTENVCIIGGFKENISDFTKVMLMKEYTKYHIGQNCNTPYECPLKKECWKTLPKDNVLQLTNWRVYWQLFHKGILELKDVPIDTKLNEKEQIIIKSLKENPQLNKTEIKKFLDKLNYPLYHFDFETFDTAIPIFDNSKPYQKIPFQYSLHIEQKNGEIEHKEFLASGKIDPRIELLKQLKDDLKGKGDIIVYNKSFEISVLKNLSNDFSKNKNWIYQALDRIVDLAEPFQQFYYYNKKQKGSYSIKKVLPALTKIEYDMEINNGADASMQYFYTHIKPELKNKKEVRNNLLKYCELDTKAMILIIDELEELVG